MIDLAVRHRQQEWMDDPRADAVTLEKSLRFIRRINTLLGYTRATLWHLKRFSQAWKPGQTIRLLDLGTGSADIPRAILRWSRQAGFDVRIVGVDLHTATAAIAAIQQDERLTIVQGDALNLPFADGSFDYALTAMFLHHLDDAQVVQVLQGMNRISSRGVIVADLLRHRRAYRWIKLMTLFANPMVRHDAAVSVAQAFTKQEVFELQRRSGLEYADYYRHFGHRFVLAGEKA